jgi:hypothetical protein
MKRVIVSSLHLTDKKLSLIKNIMAHPLLHAKSSAKKFGGNPEDYQHIHDWFDETKAWIGHSNHRAFRHHSEGIFEAEKIFGKSFKNSEDKIVYTRYVGEQHVKEDCYGHIPCAKDWIDAFIKNERPVWMMRTQELNIED